MSALARDLYACLLRRAEKSRFHEPVRLVRFRKARVFEQISLILHVLKHESFKFFSLAPFGARELLYLHVSWRHGAPKIVFSLARASGALSQTHSFSSKYSLIWHVLKRNMSKFSSLAPFGARELLCLCGSWRQGSLKIAFS